MPKDPLALYDEYYTDRDHEQLDLFQLLADQYEIQSAMYPGSYVHVTPSFVYQRVVYMDSDCQAKRFFSDPRLTDFIAARKSYPQDAQIVFYPQDYTQPVPEQEGSVDLLISLYAGFISRPCKRYLRLGGILLANNSHGDAGMASIDPDYQFIAAINRRNGQHRLTERDLDSYFIPKREVEVTAAYLEQLGRGIAYTKTAALYLFKRLT